MTRRGWLILLFAAGCSPPAPTTVSGPASAPGWEVRYNAALALARRGSDKLTDPVVQDLFLEMLDYDQQLRNFRVKLKTGQEVSDPAAARVAVSGAMSALEEYKRQKPQADLAPYRPALQKLVDGANAAVAREARGLLEKLGAKP